MDGRADKRQADEILGADIQQLSVLENRRGRFFVLVRHYRGPELSRQRVIVPRVYKTYEGLQRPRTARSIQFRLSCQLCGWEQKHR